MKKLIQYVLFLSLMFGVKAGIFAQEEIVYQHPTLGIQFLASPNWKQILQSGDKMEYELVNQNNNMQMKMWFSNTDLPVIDYLRSEVCEEGMISGDGPFLTSLDEHMAYGICAVCSEMRRPFKVMLIAMPTDEGMYLFRFKCPEECYSEHKKQIERLLSTITMEPVVEHRVFYAENTTLCR